MHMLDATSTKISCAGPVMVNIDMLLYYTAIRSLSRHVVYNAPFSCKANGDRNQLWAWLNSDPKAD